MIGSALTAPAAAQDVRVSVPLELSSGFVAVGGASTPFAGGVRAALLARRSAEGTVLAGLSAGWLRDGAGSTAAGGVRAGFRVPKLGAGDAGAYIFAEALKGKNRTPVTLTLMADLPVRPALFARFGASFTRDLDRGQNEVALLIGVDLARWVVERLGGRGPHAVRP